MTRPLIRCALALLLGLTVISYGQVFQSGFVDFDDPTFLLHNKHILSGFSLDNIVWAFTQFHGGTWQPLVWLSYMLDAELYGLKPAGFHLTNLLLHIGCVITLFLFLLHATGSYVRSFIIAAVFAVHPLNVETVAWVSERKGGLSALFALLSLLFYTQYSHRPSPKRYILTLSCYGLGLMAKPAILPLPFLMLLLDYWPLRRFNASPSAESGPMLYEDHLPERTTSATTVLLLEKIPFLLLLALGGYMGWKAQLHHGNIVPLDSLSMGMRVSNSIAAYVAYISKLLVPLDLAAIYPPPLPQPYKQVFFKGFCLLAASVAAIRYASRRPYLFVGWCWFLGMLVPVIGLFRFNLQAMADRYMYLPMVGLLLCIAWGVPDLLGKFTFRKQLLSLAALFTIVTLSLLTLSQVRHWQSSFSLFQRAVEVTKRNPIAHRMLAEQYRLRREYDAAQRHFHEAIRLQPRYTMAYNGLGFTMLELEKYDAVIDSLTPSFVVDPKNYEGRNILGVALFKLGKLEEAQAQFLEALKINPAYQEAQNNYQMVTSLLRDRSPEK
jgi:hypothetical protein